MGHRTLQVRRLARDLVNDIPQMTLHKLPKFEAFEEGSQIRRSMKSVRSTHAEGSGRRRYKQELIRFLIHALASCDETTDHLETLHETGSLSDKELYEDLHSRLGTLGRKLNLLIKSVEREHRSERSPSIQHQS